MEPERTEDAHFPDPARFFCSTATLGCEVFSVIRNLEALCENRTAKSGCATFFTDGSLLQLAKLLLRYSRPWRGRARIEFPEHRGDESLERLAVRRLITVADQRAAQVAVAGHALDCPRQRPRIFR